MGIKALVAAGLVCLLALFKQVLAQTPFDFTLSCDQTAFANWALFECRKCGANQVSSLLFSGCECDSSSIWSERSLPSYDCTACPAGELSLPNRKSCQVSSVTSCPAGSHIRFVGIDGATLASANCQNCDAKAATTIVDPEHQLKCTPCQSNSERSPNTEQCVCLPPKVDIGGFCLTEEENNTMKSKFPIFASPNFNRVEFGHLVDTSVTSSSVNIESSLFNCELKKVRKKFRS